MDFAPISRLNFEDMSCDEDTEDERSSSLSSSNNHLRKRLNFDFADDCDIDGFVDPRMPSVVNEIKINRDNLATKKKRKTELLDNSPANTVGNNNMQRSHVVMLTPPGTGSFSPCRTRSGKVYRAGNSSTEKKADTSTMSTSSIEKQPDVTADDKQPPQIGDENKPPPPQPTVPDQSDESRRLKRGPRRPTPVFTFPVKSLHASPTISSTMPAAAAATTAASNISKKQLNLLQKDLPDNMRQRSGSGASSSVEEPEPPAAAHPPPLNYVKRPVSRIVANMNGGGVAFKSTPLSDPLSPASPPTEKVKALKLIDQSPTLVTSPKTAPRWGLKSRLFTETAPRRVSAPQPGMVAASGDIIAKKRKRTANINPFTPTPMIVSLKKKADEAAATASAESKDG